MRNRLAVFFILLAGAAAAHGQATAPVTAFYYHWAAPDRLLLWRSLDDLVSAEVTLNDGKWQPGDAAGLLAQLEPQVVLRYATVEEQDRLRKAWKAQLATALQPFAQGEVDGGFGKWLGQLRTATVPVSLFIPRQPDVLIYLHVDSAVKKARLKLRSVLSNPDLIGGEYMLTLVDQKVWKKAGSIPLEIAMDVSWASPPVLEWAGIPEKEKAKFWDELIRRWETRAAGSHQQQTYATRTHGVAWAWFEVVDAEGWQRLSGTRWPVRPMVVLLNPEVNPPSTDIEFSALPRWQVALAAVLAMAANRIASEADLVLAVWWMTVGATLAMAWTLLVVSSLAGAVFLITRHPSTAGEISEAEHKGEEDPRELERRKLEQDINRLRLLEVELGRAFAAWLPSAPPGPNTPQEPVAWLRILPATLVGLTRHAADLENQIVTYHSKVEAIEAASAQQKEDDGKKIERLEQDKTTLQAQVHELDRNLDNNEKELRRTAKVAEKDKRRISELEAEQERFNQKLKAERDKLRGEHAREEERFKQEIASWKTVEENSRRLLQASEQDNRDLRSALDTARQENRSAQQRLDNLAPVAARLADLTRLEAVFPYLRQGQNQFLDDTNNVLSAGLLAFLVSHSVSHLAMSRALDQPRKAEAMLKNLHTITTRLAARYKGFGQAVSGLGELGAADGAFAEDQLAAGAEHRDSKLFQLILRQLRTAHRIELAPFYFDVTREGLVVRAN